MRERPERVGEPFRQLPHHALVGERQHVGEGEGSGVARTRLLADAGAVDDGDRLPGLGQIGAPPQMPMMPAPMMAMSIVGSPRSLLIGGRM